MGAIFAVSLARVDGVGELPGERVALMAGAGVPIWEVGESMSAYVADGGTCARRRPLTLLVGAEREGLPEDAVSACEHVAHIPIASESLNAAMAATVALYEMTRRSTRVPAS